VIPCIGQTQREILIHLRNNPRHISLDDIVRWRFKEDPAKLPAYKTTNTRKVLRSLKDKGLTDCDEDETIWWAVPTEKWNPEGKP